MLVLYGAGKRCIVLCEYLDNIKYSEFIIVDSNPEKNRTTIGKHNIYSPEHIKDYIKVTLCITVWNSEDKDIIRNCIKEKFLSCDVEEVEYNLLLLELIKRCNLVPINNRLNSYVYHFNKRNVLFDCYNGLGLGGVEAWTLNIFNELLKNENNEPYIISKKGEYDLAENIQSRIIYVDIDLQRRYSIQNVVNIINIILPKLPCNIVTCTTDDVLIAAYMIRKVYPNEISIISVVHNSFDRMYDDYIDFRECTDLYVGVSKYISNELIKRGIPNQYVLTMTCPFQCDEILKRSYSDKIFEPIHIGYAGRIEGMEGSQKRMDLMLKLIDELVKRDIDFVFEFAGDGSAKDIMEKVITNSGFEKQVKFIGRIDRNDMPLFWKRQDILVNCSDYEGHSIMQLEAMANGAVPIVTDVSGVRDDIIYDVNGYYVPRGDYYKIADKIEYLYEHRERLAEMGQKAHDSVYYKSSMEEHVKFWENILKDFEKGDYL